MSAIRPVMRLKLRTTSPELMFWLALTIKMAVSALLVSVATIIAERLALWRARSWRRCQSLLDLFMYF